MKEFHINDRRRFLTNSGALLGGLFLSSKLLAGQGGGSQRVQRWYPSYQERDRDILDYQEFQVSGCDVKFRGPGFDPFAAEQGSFFTCLGASQTYGCFQPKPFPTLLSETFGMPALNLAVGGTGPGFYLQYDSLIQAMNRGRFVILQAMAARHEANSRFEPDGYVEFVRERSTGESVNSDVAWERIVDEEPEKMLQYVEEVQANWIATTKKLVSALKVPVIFFWFARRPLDYEVDLAAVREQAARRRGRSDDGSHFIDGLAGDFPHYVNGPAARKAASLCTGYVECLSGRGMGQPIISQFTGKPVGPLPEDYATKPEWRARSDGLIHYYPSAEMHEDAAAALAPVISQILSGQAVRNEYASYRDSA